MRKALILIGPMISLKPLLRKKVALVRLFAK